MLFDEHAIAGAQRAGGSIDGVGHHVGMHPSGDVFTGEHGNREASRVIEGTTNRRQAVGHIGRESGDTHAVVAGCDDAHDSGTMFAAIAVIRTDRTTAPEQIGGRREVLMVSDPIVLDINEVDAFTASADAATGVAAVKTRRCGIEVALAGAHIR